MEDILECDSVQPTKILVENDSPLSNETKNDEQRCVRRIGENTVECNSSLPYEIKSNVQEVLIEEQLDAWQAQQFEEFLNQRLKGQESLNNWYKNWQLKEFEEALRHDVILSNNSNDFQQDLEKTEPQYLHAEGAPQYISSLEFDEIFQANYKVYFRGRMKKHQCSICLGFFSRKFDLNRHMKHVHERKRSFQCSLCPKQYGKKGELNKHVEVVHGYILPKEFKLLDTTDEIDGIGSAPVEGVIGNSPNGQEHFQCSICSINFSSTGLLKKHISIVHEGKKPLFDCSLCEASFSSKTGLSKHVAFTHKGKEPFVCPVCQKKFVWKSALKSHVLIHEGRMPYECSKCDMKFKLRFKWKQHLALVHEEKEPFECLICSAKFGKIPNLKKHMSIIHGEKKVEKKQSVECSFCFDKFDKKLQLKNHISMVHGGSKIDPNWIPK